MSEKYTRELTEDEKQELKEIETKSKETNLDFVNKFSLVAFGFSLGICACLIIGALK